jgi:putative ABC transport system substrate-binding protein
MRRRDFIKVIAGSATVWPLAARAQQSATPVIGYLDPGAPETSAQLVAAFRRGLSDTGYVEGRNVVIEYRWAYQDYNRLQELAADLVHREVTIIAASAIPAARAAKAATTTIPIVFGSGTDPVQSGLVASLGRPGGNATGVVTMNVELAGKRLGLLHELVPTATRFAVLFNAGNADSFSATRDALSVTAGPAWEIESLGVSTGGDLNAAFANFAQKRIEALQTVPELLFVSRRTQLLMLAARHRIPTISIPLDCSRKRAG